MTAEPPAGPSPGRPPLRASLSTPETKAIYVRRLFETIADRYDLITVLLSYGQDRRWKKQLVAAAGPLRDCQALDLACGTGDIAFGLAGGGARVVGLDLTPRMLQLARAKPEAAGVRAFVAGDMMALPFATARFDVVTTGYGLRNVPRLEPAIDEIRRVLRPGGLLLSLDFDRPRHPLKRAIYLSYLTIVGSALGFVLHRDPDTYRYIPESIRRYPGAAAVCRLLRAHGFATCEHVPLLGGFMAIHRAVRE
jgi:demethylmenaquinone methyltransferase / 2-methoxy-6-polyprenyl-1,4-benzoquinol methylase